jgi:hypothetical protein
MRKLKWVLAAIAAAAPLAPCAATANPIQSITTKLTPRKLPPQKFKKAKIHVEILTGPDTTDPTNPE